MHEHLPSLLQSWRDRRQPEVADLAEAITRALVEAAPRSPLGASKKAADRAAWRAVEMQHDPLDFSRLMAAARGGSQTDVQWQVQQLQAWNHPSLAKGLLTLLEDPPYAGIKSRPLLEFIFQALEATRDVRLVKPARALAKRYLTIVNSGTGGWIISELERIAKAVELFSPPTLSMNERQIYDELVQTLPPELRPKPEEPEAGGADLDALVADVYAHPDDDERRLVLAEASSAQGDPWGEFIRLQIAQARGTLAPGQTERLQALSTAGQLATWAQPLSKSGRCEFARGFPAQISLYRSARNSLGEAAWATIERVEGIENLSKKQAVEWLNHPSLANIKGLSLLTSSTFAAIEARLRLWQTLTLAEDTVIDGALLRRCPELRELTLTLRDQKECHDARLLWELPFLQKLTLHCSDKGDTALLIPPTVIRAKVLGNLAPGSFAYANRLEELLLWVPHLTRGHLEGLAHLKWLDTRCNRFDGNTFEELSGLNTLRITKNNNEYLLPKGLFAPLGGLKSLDLMYCRVESKDIEHLVQLEELRNFWTNVDEVPTFSHLKMFHCMLPREVTHIAGLLRRNPTMQTLGFCWNSGSSLWFANEPEGFGVREWERFSEVIKNSPLEAWVCDEKFRVIRREGVWRIEMIQLPHSMEYGFPKLLLQVMKTFEIPAESLPVPFFERVKPWLPKNR